NARYAVDGKLMCQTFVIASEKLTDELVVGQPQVCPAIKWIGNAESVSDEFGAKDIHQPFVIPATRGEEEFLPKSGPSLFVEGFRTAMACISLDELKNARFCKMHC